MKTPVSSYFVFYGIIFRGNWYVNPAFYELTYALGISNENLGFFLFCFLWHYFPLQLVLELRSETDKRYPCLTMYIHIIYSHICYNCLRASASILKLDYSQFFLHVPFTFVSRHLRSFFILELNL